MKLLLLTALAAVSSISYSQSNKDAFTINGKVPGIAEGKIYLSEFVINGRRDSTLIRDHSFSFTGTTGEPTPYILSLERNFVNKPLLMLFVEKGSIKITVKADDIPKSKVSGSPSQKDYAVYQSKIQSFVDQINKLADQRQTVPKENKATMDSIVNAWEAIAAKRKDAELEFIKANPGSAVSAWVITRSFIFQPDLEALESLYNNLSPAVHKTSYAIAIKDRIDKEKRFSPGQVALDFAQADTSGKMVSLKDFRGQYVLLDFWASWCGPCRAENPNVVKTFNQYKDKGFTVLSVSLDQPGKQQAWLDAIHKDNLTWTHVSDLKFWDNEVAQLYGINSVPSNFLIDPTGKIVAKNLAGEGLNEKLKEVIK